MAGPALTRLRRGAGRLARAVGLRRNDAAVRDLQARLARVRRQRDRARDRLATAEAARAAQKRRGDAAGAELDRLRAAGDLAAGRDRADLAYLFVVTYGRSGSTLLQGILSSIPGVLIRGENGGVVSHLHAFHRTVTGHRDRLARPGGLPPSHPWWGIDGYRDETALRGIRTLLLETLLRPEPDTRVVGFKEIDWPTDGLPELLDFLRAVFPGARFVLNTRDLEQVARSKWWAGKPDALGTLQAMERAMVEAVDGLGEAGYRVHYDEYVGEPRRLEGLFAWLGADWDEARIREVMAVRHSY